MGWNGQDFGRHGRHPACKQQDRRSAHPERDGQARGNQQTQATVQAVYRGLIDV